MRRSRNKLVRTGEPGLVQEGRLYEIHSGVKTTGNPRELGYFPRLADKLGYWQWLGVASLACCRLSQGPLRDGGSKIAAFSRPSPKRETSRTSVIRRPGAAARHAGERRTCHEQHLETDHPGPGAPRRSRKAHTRTGKVGVTNDTRWARGTHSSFSGQGAVELGRGPRAWGQYLLAPLLLHQPDLNYDNPACRSRC